MCISAFLLAFAQFDLSAEWSNRLECTDASLTGLGRSWGYAPTSVVQTLARYSAHAAVYTKLSLPWGIGLTAEHKCPLRRVRIPVERIKWHHVGVAWTPAHITVGEAGEKARVVDAAGAALGEDHRLPPTRTGSEYFSPIDVPVTTRPRPASAPPEGWFNMLHKTVGDVLAPANAANAANAKAEIQHIGGRRSTRRRKARRSAVRSKILRRLMPGRTHRRNVARRTRRSGAWR